MQKALIVTVTEGVELLPQAAFASSSLRSLGFEPRLLATDFCTAQDGFQTALRSAAPDAVVFIDGVEWREILCTLAGFACEVTRGPVVVSTSVPSIPAPGDFPSRVKFVADGDPRSLGSALGAPGVVDHREIALDYRLFGGPALLRRAMGSSLFGDLGTVALIAARPEIVATSPTAALARLEGALPKEVTLTPATAGSPLAALGDGARAIEWWDRSFDHAFVERLATTGCRSLPRTVRLLPGNGTKWSLGELKYAGVTRIAIECDAMDDAPADVRLPGAAGSAEEVLRLATLARGQGMEVGILLVIGLPGESAAAAARRCARISEAMPDRVRVVPFEPAGGTAAWSWCVERGFWPPPENRWNREIYQPLSQPESRDWATVLEEALMLVASVEARSRA